jgi:hypothetical protein
MVGKRDDTVVEAVSLSRCIVGRRGPRSLESLRVGKMELWEHNTSGGRGGEASPCWSGESRRFVARGARAP